MLCTQRGKWVHPSYTVFQQDSGAKEKVTEQGCKTANSGCICRFELEFCKNKKERAETLYQSFSPFMVEVWGVEPQSENRTTGLSPCAFYVLTFPLPRRRRRRCGFSSFIKSRPPQSLSGLVPCFYDADGLRRRRLRVDDRGLSRESYVFVVVSSF